MVSNILTYAKSYTTFLKEDLTSKQEAELMAARNDLIKRDKYKQVVAIEKCIEYDNFGGSAMLQDFLNKTKWVLVEPTYDRIVSWQNSVVLDLYARDNKYCLENLTFSMMTQYVYDFLDTIWHTVISDIKGE